MPNAAKPVGKDAPKKIVLVEDDPEIAEEIVTYLQKNGFVVKAVPDGATLRASCNLGEFDLMLMDLSLPGEDGISLVQYVRRESDLPILIVTGRAEIVDRVVGLEVGADDYVIKPFDLRELLARVRAHMRRARRSTSIPRYARFGEFVLDRGARRLTRGDHEEIPLTTAEFKALEALIENAGRPLSREHLKKAVSGQDLASELDRSIDNLVSRLRRKMEGGHGARRYIRTVRNEGYVFAVNPER